MIAIPFTTFYSETTCIISTISEGFGSRLFYVIILLMNYNKKTILISIGLVLVLSSILFFNKINNSQNLTVFEEIKSRISEQVEVKSKKDASFKRIKNGYAILIPATENFYINKQSDEIVEFDKAPNFFKNEISVARNVLENRGFVLNKENSSKDFSDRSFYDYVQSYEKGDNLCVVRVNPDNYQFDFSCGESLSEAYKEQLPFLEALGLKDKNATIKIKNKKDDYYEVGIGYIRTGEIAVLKKENGNYRVLYKGQEAPSCELIDEENIPYEVLISIGSGDCFDSDGNYFRLK